MDNIISFNETLNFGKTNKTLRESISSSKKNQKVILQNQKINYDPNRFPIESNIYVTQSTSFSAARSYKSNKVCVLNFANFYLPGGGVQNGASAQEECLCRESTLYECISDDYCINNFYKKHVGTNNTLASDDLIYTPGIIIFKDDQGNILEESEWKEVDIITCSAPNISFSKINDDDLLKIHLSRGRKIMAMATSMNCDTIILGAFGCGVFANNPILVAKAYNTLINEFKYSFRNIEFAIYSKNSNDINYMSFKSLI